MIQSDETHKIVVLFYKYFVDNYVSNIQHNQSLLQDISSFVESTTKKFMMKGRVLIAWEGINGTLSAPSKECMNEFIKQMESYELTPANKMFSNIDWKFSSIDTSIFEGRRQPFPDLKVSLVKEIVSTGGAVKVDEISTFGGKHLSPAEFHQVLEDAWTDKSLSKEGKRKEVVVIDVRNTFEHAIGNFQDSVHQSWNPQMVTFSEFDSKFCEEHSEYLRDKKVLMYCTGGIRCEKASVMLRKRGVDDVNQLSGGIHKYLEFFPEGFFRGKNFVFDQRVALTASKKDSKDSIVGKCISCAEKYDELSGSRICTVCRDLVLVCPECVQQLREFHCEKHYEWRNVYFTFLEVFRYEELDAQKRGLMNFRDSMSNRQKNTRRTLMKQIKKIEDRMYLLENGVLHVDSDAPRRCRTCRESANVCDGCCWGFWRHDKISDDSMHERLPINLGDSVSPGLDWNEIRYGKKRFIIGHVVEIKAWSSSGPTNDCVRVEWKNCDIKPNIYRWGHRDKSGKICYDLKRNIS